MNAWRIALLLAGTIAAAILTTWTLLFSLAYLLIGLLLLSWFWSRLSLLGLDVRRAVRNDRVVVGESVEETLTVVNRAPLPRLWLALVDWSSLPGHAPGRVLSLPPLGERSWTIRTHCRRRGEFHIGPIELRSGDPFGCFTASREIPDEHRVLVLPATTPLPDFHLPSRDLPGEARTRVSGPHSAAQVSGVRDYVAGDPFNRIHWQSTARSGRLIVKEMEHEPAADVWIALDLERSVHVGVGDDSTEEYAVAVAASIARRFIVEGRTVALATHGDRHILLQPDRGERQLIHLLEALAVARAEGTTSFGDLLRSDAMRPDRNAALVAITPSLDPAWPAALQLATTRGARAVAILVEPSTFGGRESSLMVVGRLAAAHIPTYLVKRGVSIGDVLTQAR